MSEALSDMDWHGGLTLLDMMNLLYGYFVYVLVDRGVMVEGAVAFPPYIML